MFHPHALRSLKRTPVFAAAVILTLVLGLAAAGAMFAILHGVLLAPLPYAQPDRLVSVALQAPAAPRMPQPPAVYFTYERFARHLAGVAFYRTGNANLRVGKDGGSSERVTATWMTASMVPVLGIAPLLGRSFTAEEERMGGPGAVVLSEHEWRNRFGAARDVIGRTLVVNDVEREIVGVMPARFAFPSADTRVWLPARLPTEAVVVDFMYAGVARLAAGATAEQAQRELAAVLPRMAGEFPKFDSGASTAAWLAETRPVPVVAPLRDEVTSGIARTLWMLGAAAGLVLLVAWANAANLMLIRADDRQLELAVREALGASRWRVATHFFGESLLLGAAAGAIALLLAHAAVRALVAFGPAEIPRLGELGIGPASAGFIALATAVSVLLCAAVPALRAARTRPPALRAGGRGDSAGKDRQRLRASIVTLQMAIALVITVGSALLLRTAHGLREVHPGFDGDRVTTFWTLLPFANYDDARSVEFYRRLVESARRLPSVTDAGLTARVPLGGGSTLQQSFRAEGDAALHSLPVNVVDDGYFATLRIPLLAGRAFRGLGHEQGGDIVISALAAANLFGDASGASVVGKRLTLAPAGPTYTVVGVVGDVRDRDLATPPAPLVYRPQAVRGEASAEPGARHTLALVARTGGPPGAIVPAIRSIAQALDPAVPVFDVETMDDVLRASTARLTFVIALVTAAAAITLLLGAIGLYGVMSYTVALRTREFGVRVALGADPRRIARWVVARGLALAAGGIAIGFLLYAAAAPLLRAFLYGVTTTDPAMLAGATLVLLATATLASWLPARRAARVDPATALRAE